MRRVIRAWRLLVDPLIPLQGVISVARVASIFVFAATVGVATGVSYTRLVGALVAALIFLLVIALAALDSASPLPRLRVYLDKTKGWGEREAWGPPDHEFPGIEDRGFYCSVEVANESLQVVSCDGRLVRVEQIDGGSLSRHPSFPKALDLRWFNQDASQLVAVIEPGEDAPLSLLRGMKSDGRVYVETPRKQDVHHGQRRILAPGEYKLTVRAKAGSAYARSAFRVSVRSWNDIDMDDWPELSRRRWLPGWSSRGRDSNVRAS